MMNAEATAIADTQAAKQPGLVRHTAYYLTGRIATGLVGLLALVAFTRVLSPTDYGRYSVIIAIGALIAGTGFQWLRQCLVRFGTGVDGERQPLLGTLGALLAGQALLLVVIGTALALLVERGQWHAGVSAADIVAICALVAAQAWFELAADAARVEFRPWRYGMATLLRALLSLVLGVLAALLLHSVALVVLAMAAAYLLASAATTPRWLAGLLRVKVATLDEVKRLCHYGLPLAGTLGLQFILDSADRLMLAGMRGYAEAGVYSSAYNLAQFSMGTVLGGLGLSSLPLVVHAMSGKTTADAARLLGNNLTLGVGIALPAVIGLAILAPGLDRLLLGNNSPGRSALVTMTVAVGIGFAALRSYCVDVVFMLHHRTWLQALIIAGAALLNVGLNWIWIPRWGATGAAVATLAAFLAAFVGSWFLSQRYLKIPVALADIGKIMVAATVMAVALTAMLPNGGHWSRLVAAIVGGAAVYAAAILALDAFESRARLRQYVTNVTKRFGGQ